MYIYNEEIFNDLALFELKHSTKYKDMTKEEAHKKVFLKECEYAIANLITKKLQSVNAYQPFSAEGLDISMLIASESLPFEVYPNVCEWVNGDEFSEIDYKGLSIKEMEKRMNFPSFEQGQIMDSTLTREKYEEVKARCYLKMFCYMGNYAQSSSEDPRSTLNSAACIYWSI